MTTRLVEVYGEGGYDESKPNNNVVESYEIEVPTEETNADTLRDRAEKALAANRTYLALQSPTNAQNVTQIKLLTREATALIRLLLNRFEDTE